MDLVPFMISEIIKKQMLIVTVEGSKIVCSVLTTFKSAWPDIKILGLKEGHYWEIIVTEQRRKTVREEFVRPTLTMPYITEKVNKQIVECFRREKLECNVVFRGTRVY